MPRRLKDKRRRGVLIINGVELSVLNIPQAAGEGDAVVIAHYPLSKASHRRDGAPRERRRRWHSGRAPRAPWMRLAFLWPAAAPPSLPRDAPACLPAAPNPPQLLKISERPDPRQLELEFQTTSRAAHPSLFGFDNRGGGGSGRGGAADGTGAAPPGSEGAAARSQHECEPDVPAAAARQPDGAAARPSLDLADGVGFAAAAAAAVAGRLGSEGPPDSPDAQSSHYHPSPLQPQSSGDAGGAGTAGAAAGHGRWRAYLHRAASFSSGLAAVGGGGERHQRFVRDEWGELRAVHVDTFVLTFRCGIGPVGGGLGSN
jgi:hypothetical protein